MFKLKYTCDDCGETQLSRGEPTYCDNKKCSSHTIVDCKNCRYFRKGYPNNTCVELDSLYDILPLSNEDGRILTNCDIFNR